MTEKVILIAKLMLQKGLIPNELMDRQTDFLKTLPPERLDVLEDVLLGIPDKTLGETN